MSPAPTWYEILDVPRDASAEQIKAAWRHATDKFEPGSGSGQFRLFNEAADVLLDPARRAEYDATLPTGGRVEPTPVATPAPAPAPAVPLEQTRDGGPRTLVIGQHGAVPSVVEERGRRPRRARSSRTRAPRAGARSIPAWALGLLALVALAALVTAGVLWNLNREAAAAAQGGEEAQAAAERALPQVLSYDYRTLPADRDRAMRYLSPAYRKEYGATFDQLIQGDGSEEGGAAQTKAVVKATVVNSAIERSTPDRARIVMFLDQSAQKNGLDPQFSLNRLAVSMVRADDQWLVDDIVSY